MGCCLNRLDELVFSVMSKPLLTEFGIHPRLESCEELTENTVWWCTAYNALWLTEGN